MICPKCNKGSLEEIDFYDYIGQCDTCGAMFEDTSSPYSGIEKEVGE